MRRSKAIRLALLPLLASALASAQEAAPNGLEGYAEGPSMECNDGKGNPRSCGPSPEVDLDPPVFQAPSYRYRMMRAGFGSYFVVGSTGG